MKIITLDTGKTYLGEITEKVINAIEIDKFNKAAIIKFVKKRNLDEMSTLTISDVSGYTITELNEEQEKLVKRVFDIFQEAETKAAKYTINSVFDKLVQKYDE